jgi:iron complex outermembrane receptor protein
MGNLVPGAPRPKTPFQTALTFVPELWVNQFTASLRTHFEIGPVVLETTSAYMHDHVHQKSDTDGSPVIASQNLFLQDTDRSQSHEVRFLSDTNDKFKWILGAFFYDMKGDVKTTGDNANPPTFRPVVTSVRTPEATVQSMAVFGEATLALTDRLKVTGGLRYTTENRSWIQYFNGNILVPRQKTSYDKATYRGIIQYEFAEKSNIFVSYSTGFKSGLFNTFGSTPLDRVAPETIDAWEVGVKSDPLPWLRTNISAFHYDYKNLQVVARVPDAFGAVSYRLLNAASSKIYGGEVEIQALLPAGFSIAASGSYLHARYDHFPNAQLFIPKFQNGLPIGNAIGNGDTSGNHMIKAPDYTLSLQVDWNHKFDNGSGIGANVSVYRSDTVYYDFQNRMNQPAYTRLNASASYTLPGDRLTFTVYGTNLTDEAIIQQGSPTVNVDQVTYERPREVGVRADFRF